MQLVIISFRNNNDHHYNQKHPTSLEIKIAKDEEEAIEYIANRVFEDTWADYSHALFDRWEDLVSLVHSPAFSKAYHPLGIWRASPQPAWIDGSPLCPGSVDMPAYFENGARDYKNIDFLESIFDRIKAKLTTLKEAADRAQVEKELAIKREQTRKLVQEKKARLTQLKTEMEELERFFLEQNGLTL